MILPITQNRYMRYETRPDYSWRADPRVPAFDDDAPLAVMDGDCGLCSRTARVLSRLDRAGTLRICTAQGSLGRALMTHAGLRAEDPETWLALIDGRLYGGADAVMAMGRTLGGLGHSARLLYLVPRQLRDPMYRSVARNRYRLLGRTEMCSLPDPALRARLYDVAAPKID